MGNNPHFLPTDHSFCRAARGRWRQLETLNLQRTHGTRLNGAAVRPRALVMPAPEAELLSTPAGPLQRAGPVRLQEQEHHLSGCALDEVGGRPLAAFGAFEAGFEGWIR